LAHAQNTTKMKQKTATTEEQQQHAFKQKTTYRNSHILTDEATNPDNLNTLETDALFFETRGKHQII